MTRSLWISKTGLDAQQTKMDVIANNLANVSTNGFRRARAVVVDLRGRWVGLGGEVPRLRQ